jgi:hypothetical protein
VHEPIERSNVARRVEQTRVSAGRSPRIATSRSIDCSKHATRPNASDAAQNATTSTSSGRL